MKPFFRAIYRGWMKFAHAWGTVMTFVLLTVVFVVIGGPSKLWRLIRRAPGDGASHWKAKPEPDPAMPERRRMKFQF